MDELRLAVDPAWGVGLLLAMTRVAAFAIASPLLTVTWPASGRLAAIVAVSLFLVDPVPGVADIGPLVVASVTNATVGIVLGVLTSVIINLLVSAGQLIDIMGGLAVAQVFDPGTGVMAAIWGRLLQRLGIALLVVGGGAQTVIRSLAASTRIVPLGGEVTLDPWLAEEMVRQTSAVMIGAVQLAMPVLSALFVTEIVLGIASRFAPQANVLLLGLPAKLLIAMSVVGSVVLTMPASMRDLAATMADTSTDVLRVLGS